jgi:Leucine Rich repeat
LRSCSEIEVNGLIRKRRRRILIGLFVAPLAILFAILLILYPFGRAGRDKADERFGQMSIHVERDWTRFLPLSAETVNRSVVRATCSRAFSSVKAQELAACPNLVELDLSHCDPVDVGGLERLASLPKVRTLSLTDARVDDSALTVLATWPALEGLALDGTKVSKIAVQELLLKKKLRRVSIARTNITATELDALREAFSGVEIES